MKRLIKKSDLDNLEVNLVSYGAEDSEDGHYEEYAIDASINGEEAGFLTLFVYQDYDGGAISELYEGQHIEKLLYIDNIEVDPKFREKGVTNAILKKFGEFYNEKFNGWPILNMFINPIAEYAIVNAVAKGWLPQEAFVEEYQFRDSAYNNKQQITDLRNRLPEEYQHLFAPGKG